MQIKVVTSKEMEIRRVLNTLKDTLFFDKNGYTPKLPSNPAFEVLKQHARQKRLTAEEFKIAEIITGEAYDSQKEKYDNTCKKVEEYTEEVWRLFKSLPLREYEGWGFKVFPEYIIVPTLYGIGGSYNHEKGMVFTQLTEDPERNRSRTLHEMVHVGIEEAVVKKYNLDQNTKEYIVDRFMIDHFGDIFPHYQEQKSTMRAEPRVRALLQQQGKPKFDWRNIDREMWGVYRSPVPYPGPALQKGPEPQ